MNNDDNGLGDIMNKLCLDAMDVIIANGQPLTTLTDIEISRTYWDDETKSVKTELISREEFLRRNR